jgi:NAD(P)-dependent dehydrogenase (short-subunit alcohol dehydrogenase family)
MGTSIHDLFDLHGQVALVTGGSRGLGLQIAEALGEAGARIVLTSRKAADLEEAAADLQAKGIDTRWIAADASDPAEVRRVVAEAMERVGRIDILVNNAGATWGAPAVGKASMLPRKAGRILNIASIAGLAGSHQMEFIAYATSKGAVVNFTRQLAGEWGPFNVNVNALAPGFFPSRMTHGTLKALGVDKLADSAPLRRIGDDDDLKGAALLLCSRAGKHITGQVLAIDGGISAVHHGG